MTYKAFIGLALSSIIMLLPKPADAQWLNQQLQQWTQPPASYPGQEWQSLPAQQPISRQQLEWMNQLGGGQDEFGNFNQPIPSDRVLPGSYPDGLYRFPMQWDQQNSIMLNIQGGQIRRQDYVIPQ